MDVLERLDRLFWSVDGVERIRMGKLDYDRFRLERFSCTKRKLRDRQRELDYSGCPVVLDLDCEGIELDLRD